jgi:ABC-type branched-subunit amino acid transport system ATPase component
LSGYVVPDRGVIELFGRPVGRSKPHARSRAGLARTFQTPMVFEEMTCVENVMTALDHGRRRSLLSYALRLPPARGEERRCYERATHILAAVGLGARRDAAASSLPPGERRLLELARVVALEPRAVLMDEPAAGLSRSEIDELDGVIRALRAKGIAVLLVEHHVDFVMRLADVVTVIDFGRVIAHGAPDEVRSDPAVVTAYLGVEDATAAPLDGVRSPEPSAAGLESGSA